MLFSLLFHFFQVEDVTDNFYLKQDHRDLEEVMGQNTCLFGVLLSPCLAIVFLISGVAAQASSSPSDSYPDCQGYLVHFNDSYCDSANNNAECGKKSHEPKTWLMYCYCATLNHEVSHSPHGHGIKHECNLQSMPLRPFVLLLEPIALHDTQYYSAGTM